MIATEESGYIIHIAKQLNIPLVAEESEKNWFFRVLYSAIAVIMLSSLYDYDEKCDGQTVSLQHVRSRGIALIDAYQDIFSCFPVETFPSDQLAEYIRNLLIANGYALHKAGALSPAPLAVAALENIIYIRGGEPWKCRNMSGAGLYSTESEHRTHGTFWDMMHFEHTAIDSWFKSFLKRMQWKAIDAIPDDMEFYNTRRRRGERSWGKGPPIESPFLGRTATGTEVSYALFSKDADGLRCASLPGWLTENGEYRRIALALKSRSNTPPFAEVESCDELTYVRLSDLLPPSEQHLFELYSWPGDGMSKWRRSMKTEVYYGLRLILTDLGFTIVEVKNDCRC